MTAGDGHILNNFKEQILLGEVDCKNDIFKIALYSGAYDSAIIDEATPVYSSTDEIVASGYTAGGMSLTNLSITQNDTDNLAYWNCDDVTWTALGTATITKAVLYDDSIASKYICVVWELGTNSNGANYTLHNVSGLLALS